MIDKHFNLQDLIVNNSSQELFSSLAGTHFTVNELWELILDEDNFYLISFSVFITCLQDNVWIF